MNKVHILVFLRQVFLKQMKRTVYDFHKITPIPFDWMPQESKTKTRTYILFRWRTKAISWLFCLQIAYVTKRFAQWVTYYYKYSHESILIAYFFI